MKWILIKQYIHQFPTTSFHQFWFIPPSLYTPPFLPECSSECFPFFTIHLFFCSIWVPLIGGGSGFPVLHTTLKNRLSEHFIFFFFSVKPIGTNSKKDYVYLQPSNMNSHIYIKGLRRSLRWSVVSFWGVIRKNIS